MSKAKNENKFTTQDTGKTVPPSKIGDINDLRLNLCAGFEQIRDGELDLNKARQMSNNAGKVLSACRTEMDFNKHSGNRNKNIPFLNVQY